MQYLDHIEDISLHRLVYIDESGIDHNMVKESCWAQKGQIVIGENANGAQAF